MTTTRTVRRTGGQAAGLRAATGLAAPLPTLPAVAVTGGKGGVGKTCIAVNLACALAGLGQRPLLVDLDLGLANADVLLGVDPPRGLAEVILGGADPASVVTATPHGVHLLPAASGREDLTALSEDQHHRLFQAVARCAGGHDLVVLDTAAGIHRTVTTALRCARVVLLAITPDPTSLTDAYALLKVLESHEPGRDVRVVVNQAGNLAEAQATCQRLREVARRFLGRDLVFAGWIPRDRALTDAVRARRPVVAMRPTSPAAVALRQLAQRILAEDWAGIRR
jgi:flagellar biosynthesis protein FlhG